MSTSTQYSVYSLQQGYELVIVVSFLRWENRLKEVQYSLKVHSPRPLPEEVWGWTRACTPPGAICWEASASRSSSHISLSVQEDGTCTPAFPHPFPQGVRVVFVIGRGSRHWLGHAVLVDGLIHLQIKSRVGVFSVFLHLCSIRSASPLSLLTAPDQVLRRMTKLSWFAGDFPPCALKLPSHRNCLSPQATWLPFSTVSRSGPSCSTDSAVLDSLRGWDIL